MKQIILISLIALISCNKMDVTVTLPVCPDCLEVGCIYESIDSMSDGTDESTFNAIMYISKERNLTDKQTDLLLTEYYL